MVVGIQIVGVIFAIAMMYFTYFYYRRNEFRKGDLALWSVVWLLLLLGVLFPQRLNGVFESFGVVGALQFFSITSILFLVATVFYLYRTVRANEHRVEKLVRELALNKK